MQIPLHFAKRPMETGQLPRAPARELADIGGELPGRGLEAMGRGTQQAAFALAQIERRFLEVEGNSQFDTARRQAATRLNELDQWFNAPKQPGESDEDYAKRRDSSGYQKEYEAALRDIKGFTPKNPIGARKFETWKDYYQPQWEVGVTQAQRHVVKLNAQAAYHQNLGGIGTLKTREEA